nr:heterotrimeric guanine nucleotide-binding protein 3M2 [Oryctolagus cuniculus]
MSALQGIGEQFKLEPAQRIKVSLAASDFNTCQGRPAGGRSMGNNLLPEPGSCFPLNCKQEVH